MKTQTPEQNYERIKKVYAALGRDMPDEAKVMLQGVKIIIDMNPEGVLTFSVCEDLMALDEMRDLGA